jgi:ketosteroid isomerase-like protein
MSQANVDLLNSLYAAFARGDAATVLSAMDPAIVWNEAENFPYADGNPYVGPAAIAEGVFGRVLSEFANFQVNPAEILDAGDTVVALGRYTGICNATGAPLNAQFAHVWRFRDGKPVRFDQYADTLQMARVRQGQAGAADA